MEYIRKIVREIIKESFGMKEAISDWNDEHEANIKVASNLGYKLGKPFGSGEWGIVYNIEGHPNKLYKVTTDFDEMDAAKWIEGKESEYMANVYKAIETDEGYMIIVMERLEPLNDEYKKSLNQFYVGMENYYMDNNHSDVSEFNVYDAEGMQGVLGKGLDKNFESYLKEKFPSGVKVYHDLLNIWNEATKKHKLAPLTDIQGENMGIKNNHLAIFDIK